MPEYTPKSGIQRWAIQEAIGVDRRNPETLEWETALGVKPFGPIGYREAPRITFGTGAGTNSSWIAGDGSGIFASKGSGTVKLACSRTGSLTTASASPSSPRFAPYFGWADISAVTPTAIGSINSASGIGTYTARAITSSSVGSGGSIPVGDWAAVLVSFELTDWGKVEIGYSWATYTLTAGNQTINLTSSGVSTDSIDIVYLYQLNPTGLCYRATTNAYGVMSFSSLAGMPQGYVWNFGNSVSNGSVTSGYCASSGRIFYINTLPLLRNYTGFLGGSWGEADLCWSDAGFVNHAFTPSKSSNPYPCPNSTPIPAGKPKAIVAQSSGVEVFTDTSSWILSGDFTTTSGTRVTQRPTFVGSDGSACVSTGRTWSVWQGSIWNVDSGEEIENQPVGLTFVSVAFDPRFNSLVALTSTGYAYGYDIPTGRWYYLDDNGTRTSVRDYAFQTPQGVYLAESGTNGSLYSLTVEPQGTQKLSWRELSFGYPVDQKQLHRILLSFDYSERTIPNDTTFPISNVVLRRMEDMSTNIPTTIQRLSRNWYEIVPDTSAIGRQFYLSMDVNYSRCKTVFCPIIFEFTPLEAAR